MTVFLRLLDIPPDRKADALREAIQGGSQSFTIDPESFRQVPGSPFAYWVSGDLQASFSALPAFETDERIARFGLVTADDFRWLRLWWEVPRRALSKEYVPFVKGGVYSPFYADVQLTIRWDQSGRLLKEWKAEKLRQGAITANNSKCWNESHYFRPGLTWPARTQSGLAMRVLPAGCIFGGKGPCTFDHANSPRSLLALLGIVTSSTFRYLVELQMAFGSYEVGVIQRTPVPQLVDEDEVRLGELVRRAWSLKRRLDSANETSHAFVLPPRLAERVTGLDSGSVHRELETLQAQIDEIAFKAYGVGDQDRTAIQEATNTEMDKDVRGEPKGSGDEGGDDEDELVTGVEAEGLYSSWLIGVAFGRFNPRVAAGERPLPPEPEPYDPLPSRSPGMWAEVEEPAQPVDILVDDEGHPDDLVAGIRAAAERVGANVGEDVRGWLATEFFSLHLKMYSKSRRKAPVYWQLATSSASYAVWLYIHAFTKDTLFRVQNDYVAPKLAHEERRLELLTRELRDRATGVRRKELAAQENLVDELRAFLEEVKRVAPLWNPYLDDGVVINFAPLWRLVPQHKPWQKELKSTWNALSEGKYDWTHLAMYLWPERVVPKCANDRSLAIAHGLEDLFWVDGTDGKWTARKTPTGGVEELVRERTSPAVKSALKSLLDASATIGNGGGGRGGRRRADAAAEGGDA